MSSSADPESSGVFIWVQAFVAELERAGIEAIVYPSSTLGSEIVRSQQVLLGLLEVNVTGTQEIEIYSDLIAAFELPFLFSGNHEPDALFHHTDYRDALNRDTVPHGIRVADLAMIGGMTGIFTARAPVETLEDVSSFRLRAMVSDQIDWVESWGGSATKVAWEEVPQALQTGIADGYINPPIVAYLFGHGGQLDYFTDLAIVPSVRVIVFSETWYQSLSPTERDAVDEAVVRARAANRNWVQQTVKSELALLESIGIDVIQLSPPERDKFRAPLLSSYQTKVDPITLNTINQYIRQARQHLLQSTDSEL
ncbi:MAG: TRAP transporter substrate-binding protein [Pseudomonadota bacterium]